jgi:hypothetical protein
MDKPFHSIYCHIPVATIHEVLGSSSVDIESLNYEPGIGFEDGVLKNLLLSVRPALGSPRQVDTLFVDHVAVAMIAYLVATHGQRRLPPAAARLAPWQEHQAREMLEVDVADEFGVYDLAREFDLPLRDFTKAFTATVGMSPYQWVKSRRRKMLGWATGLFSR